MLEFLGSCPSIKFGALRIYMVESLGGIRPEFKFQLATDQLWELGQVFQQHGLHFHLQKLGAMLYIWPKMNIKYIMCTKPRHHAWHTELSTHCNQHLSAVLTFHLFLADPLTILSHCFTCPHLTSYCLYVPKLYISKILHPAWVVLFCHVLIAFSPKEEACSFHYTQQQVSISLIFVSIILLVRILKLSVPQFLYL